MPGTRSRGLSRDLIVQHIKASESEHVALLGTFRQIWINWHFRVFAASLRAQSGKLGKGTRVSRMFSVMNQSQPPRSAQYDSYTLPIPATMPEFCGDHQCSMSF